MLEDNFIIFYYSFISNIQIICYDKIICKSFVVMNFGLLLLMIMTFGLPPPLFVNRKQGTQLVGVDDARLGPEVLGEQPEEEDDKDASPRDGESDEEVARAQASRHAGTDHKDHNNHARVL